ncbi:putative NUDIX hydrolase [Leclercia adecarboxylata]|uniref:Putative NUDIX hydrolase n=1 Tax=Leclercia adecarboxylata TaxID=83655 RepID=A0A4V6JIT3_9ENTR|nr:putative NUDIX hydrolase [Leclercia adecarboxylata]
MDTRDLTLDNFLSRFQLLRPQVNSTSLNQRQAAVLIPVVRREQPGLLLTRRSSQMRKHAGQVAFPGGAVDSTDASLIAAALREAQEEVAIPPHKVEVIGVLPPGGQRDRFSGDAGCRDYPTKFALPCQR